MLGNFNLALDPARLEHRLCWIVRDEAERVLVDAMTGEVRPLAAMESSGTQKRRSDSNQSVRVRRRTESIRPRDRSLEGH